MKLLIIGMNPANRDYDHRKGNPTLNRLYSWLDQLNVKHFSYINTFDTPTNTPKFSYIDYNRLFTITQNYDKIICLGKFVSTAMNKLQVFHFCLPHPSPRNRKLNDYVYVQKIIDECGVYLKS